MNKWFSVFVTVAVIAVFLIAVISVGWVVNAAVTDIKTNGVKGVVEQLWCGEKGCAK